MATEQFTVQTPDQIAVAVAESAGWCWTPHGRGKRPRHGLADFDGVGVIRETVARVARIDADLLPDLLSVAPSGPSLDALKALFGAMGLKPVKHWRTGDVVIYATHDGRHEPGLVLSPEPVRRDKTGRWIGEHRIVRQACGCPITMAWMGRMTIVAAYRIYPAAVRAAAASTVAEKAA
ncbi:MAG: hypothetical protein ACOY4K_00435 [Pseudomonadota bacterium]